MPNLGERDEVAGEKKEKEVDDGVEVEVDDAAAKEEMDDTDEPTVPADVTSRMWEWLIRGERGNGAANVIDDSGGDGCSALMCGLSEAKPGEKPANDRC